MHRFVSALLIGFMALAPVDASAQSVPQFTLVPDLRIDAHTEDLSPVTWLAIGRTGTIAIGQAQDHLIRFYDPAGHSLGTFGREGEGPGEFERLTGFGVGWVDDTMWVLDNSLRRFTLIGPDRKLLRTTPGTLSIKSQDLNADKSSGSPIALYPGGAQLMYAIVPSAAAERPAWAQDPHHLDTRLALVNVTAAGTFDRLVSFEPGDDCGMAPTMAYQLCGHPKFGMGPRAERMAWATMAYAGPDSGTYQVTSFDRHGRTIFSRRYPFAAQPIPGRIRDSLIELAKKVHTPTMPPALSSRFPPPAIYAAVESVIVGADGSTMIGLRATAAGNPWVMLSPLGDVTGTVVAPANAKLMVVDRGRIYGTEKDSDDVESVVRFRLIRRN